MPKNKYVVKGNTLFVKFDKNFYREEPDNNLVAKEDLEGAIVDTNDAEEALYWICCRSCPDAKCCHEECENICEDDEDSRYSEILKFIEGDV